MKQKRAKWGSKCIICEGKRGFQDKLSGYSICNKCMIKNRDERYRKRAIERKQEFKEYKEFLDWKYNKRTKKEREKSVVVR